MGPLTAVADFIQRWLMVGLIIASAIACVKIAELKAEVAEAKLEASTQRADRESAARVHEAALAKREQTHRTKEQEKEDEYVAGKVAFEKRIAVERADAGRLRTQLAESTARSGAGSATDPVACERAFYRLEELGELAGEGAGLLQEARELLRERDTDTRRLWDQLINDREAFGHPL